MYRSINEITNEHLTLKKWLTAILKSAMLHYSYALALVRSQQKELAVVSFEKAKKFGPNNARFTYAYWLSLDEQIIELGLYFAKKSNDKKSYLLLLNLPRTKI